MQTSRFQLGLIATLAVGLGFSLSSSDAVGYPAGPAVSLGTNPIWNEGGDHYSTTPKPIITAPGEQDVVMTYLNIQNLSSNYTFELRLGDGTLLGSYVSWNNGAWDPDLGVGIRVPAGQTLYLHWSVTASVWYAASGYYAQP